MTAPAGTGGVRRLFTVPQPPGLPALALLGLRSCMRIGGLPGAALLILALLELEAIVPVWAALYERLKEIEGGEENDAAQY